MGVEGLVEEALELSLDDLRDGRFAPVEVTATLQCAGNRRVELAAVREIPGEASCRMHITVASRDGINTDEVAGRA